MSIGAMSTIGRREVFCVLYSKTVLPHRPVCFCWLRAEKCVSNKALQRKPNFREIVFSSAVCPHLAAILQHAVCEATVALCADLHIVGALQQQSLLQVACGLVHVGNAVLAVVSEVLGCFSGQEPQEGQLDCCSVGSRAILSVAELYDRGRGQGIKD